MAEENRWTRREIVVGAAGFAAGASGIAGGISAAAAGATGAGAAPRPETALLELGAREAVAAMHSGQLRAEEYARALLAQCERGRALNAFITLRPEGVLEAARAADAARSRGTPPGPLHGLPIPVKDSVNTADLPTTAGTAALKNFQPRADAPVVAKLRAAGALVLGKNNLHELSYGYSSNNAPFGAVHNPYATDRISGGSSGGTAAAVAFRMAPLGVAEDTEGSIRIPAALCGIAGFRPTTGRYPTTGCAPISPVFDQVGPHARSVTDLALWDEVLTGATPLGKVSLRGLRLGVVRGFFFQDLDPEVERITDEALARLRGAGVELVEGELPPLSDLIALTTGPVQAHDTRPALTRYLADYHAGVSFDALLAQVSPRVRAVIERAVLPGGSDFVPDAQYAEILRVHLPALRKLYKDYFARTGVTAVVFPATLLPAPPIGAEDTVTLRGRSLPFDVALPRNIDPGSTTGLPGLVLPAGLTRGGLPVSLEFDGPAGSDRELLAAGLALEEVLGRLPAPRHSSA